MQPGSRVRVKATALKGIVIGSYVVWPKGKHTGHLRLVVRPEHGPELMFAPDLLEIDPSHKPPAIADTQYGPWPIVGGRP